MQTLKTRTSVFGSSLLLALASLGVAREAQASQSFPPEVQKALATAYGKDFCVPGCTFCHLTTAGGPQNMNPFGKTLENQPGPPSAITAAIVGRVQPALVAYFGTPAAKGPAGTNDSNGNGITDWDEVNTGMEPGTANILCADIKYGCGASVAKAKPPVDSVGLFSAGLAVLGLAVLRRRQRAR